MKNIMLHNEPEAVQVDAGAVRRIMGSLDQLMVCELELTKGGPVNRHSHPHDQITYIVKGTLEFCVEGEKAIVHAGDTMCIPGGIEHGPTEILEDSVIIDTFSPKRDDFVETKE